MTSERMAPWAAYGVVGVGALIMLAPFYFMFVFATHSRGEIFSLPPPLFFGDDFFNNLKILTERLPFWRNLGWSLYVAIASTVLTLLFCSMGGYAFALFDFRFKNALFGLVMGTMLLPSFMNMIPTFMIMDALGWIDQPKALYIPGAASAFGIFLMRQFVNASIPKDLVEAARMDGCSELGIYARIVLPLLKPALGTLGLITLEQLHRALDRHAQPRHVHPAVGAAQPAKPGQYRVGRVDGGLSHRHLAAGGAFCAVFAAVDFWPDGRCSEVVHGLL
jgi:multiple sugar transport system permease protein